MTTPDRGWHYRRSLASRVTLLTTMAVGLAVAFVSLGAYVTMRIQLQDTLDESLVSRAQAAASDTTLQQSVGRGVPSWALGAGDIRVAYLDTNTEGLLYSADNVAPVISIEQPEFEVAVRNQAISIRTVETDADPYRVVTVPAGKQGQALVLAQSLGPQNSVLTKLGVVMGLFGLAGVITAGMAGWGVARNGLRPVRYSLLEGGLVARTEQLTPIPVEGDDEVARLATAFNQMLHALELSRERQRRLVADASHELRTPLTSLRTNIELLTQVSTGDQPLPAEARDELLADVRAQIEELSTLVGDLVELARDTPVEGAAGVVQEVDLADVLEQALLRVRRRAPGVAFAVEAEPWLVRGEPQPLERAITNLLDNAAKWSPVDGTVHVVLADGTLTVDDEGPGIADEDLPHVFERFYRAEESRSMPGSGLGLSIVAQAAERHAGSVEAGRSPHGGARMTLSLPGEQPALP